jgi:hypothetical protein
MSRPSLWPPAAGSLAGECDKPEGHLAALHAAAACVELLQHVRLLELVGTATLPPGCGGALGFSCLVPLLGSCCPFCYNGHVI